MCPYASSLQPQKCSFLKIFIFPYYFSPFFAHPSLKGKYTIYKLYFFGPIFGFIGHKSSRHSERIAGYKKSLAYASLFLPPYRHFLLGYAACILVRDELRDSATDIEKLYQKCVPSKSDLIEVYLKSEEYV